MSTNIIWETPSSSYLVRITDIDLPANQTQTEVFEVKPELNDILSIQLVWDHSYENQEGILKGVAADGVARLFLKVSKKDESQGPDITEVAVRLDDEDGNQETRTLGKVMAATQIDTYNLEANQASSIHASTMLEQEGAFWFWYVAPIDFTGINSNDRLKAIRKVLANVEATFSDGGKTVQVQEIKIVRPPLMLVHGLGGSPETWNNFRHNFTLNGGDKKFIEDFRFIYKKTH